MMPLPAAAIRQIEERLRLWRYERIVGAFPGQDVLADGPAIVARSAQRYVELIAS